ncbi:MAG: hypothetical protein GX444_03220 [Myxococcales bacterium]|nr:hypothetical protein [Myxococcales bacterium]
MNSATAEMRFLLVRKQRLSSETLADHVSRLSGRHHLDAYQLHLTLNGDGLAVLARGEPGQMRAIGSTLTELGYSWCVVDPAVPPPELAVVRRFSILNDRVEFEGQRERGELVKGTAVLAVLASLESELLSSLVRKSTLLGGKTVRLSSEEKYQELIHSETVLDLYPLPDSPTGSSPERIVGWRFFPGKFDPASLGERATNSARQNMGRLIDLFRENAGNFFLEMDFGLFQIPGCRFENSDALDADEQNLRAITKYGWYLRQLYEQGYPLPPAGGAGNSLPGLIVPDDRQTAEPSAEETPEPLPPPPLLTESKAWPGNLWRREVILPAVVFVFWFLGPLIATVIGEKATGILLYWGLRRGLFFFTMGAACFYGGFHNLRLKRWVDNTPTSRTRSAAMGMVEIKGRAERAYNLVSPLSQVPCVYYRLQKFKKKNRYDRSQSAWVLANTQTSGPVPFYLCDESGRAQVNPAGATIRTNQVRDVQGQLTSLWGSPILLEDDTRYVEEILPEGALIYVLGFATPRREEAKPVHRRLLERLRQVKQDPVRRKQFDLNGDGRIDEDEWEAARAEVEREVLAETLAGDQQTKPSAEQVIVGKPPLSGLPFVISQSTEEKLTTNITLWIAACFIGAGLLTAIGLLAVLG